MKSRIDTAENPISNVVDKYKHHVEKKNKVRLGQGVGCHYKRATSGIFVVMELFCALTVEVENGPTHLTKLHITKYVCTHTHRNEYK